MRAQTLLEQQQLIGDCVILDKSGTTPEWGYVTAVTSATELAIAGGFSSGGTGSGRSYIIVDKSAYTGAQVVKIEYLTNAFAQKSEIVVLNGTGVVDTVNTDLYRVNSFRVIATGTGNVSVGNITLRADGGGATYSYITAGYTRARNITYTVPAGKTLYITQWIAGAVTSNDTKVQSCRLFLKANAEPSTKFLSGNIFYGYSEFLVTNTMEDKTFTLPLKFNEKTDIKVSAIGLTGFNGSVTAELTGWLE